MCWLWRKKICFHTFLARASSPKMCFNIVITDYIRNKLFCNRTFLIYNTASWRAKKTRFAHILLLFEIAGKEINVFGVLCYLMSIHKHTHVGRFSRNDYVLKKEFHKYHRIGSINLKLALKLFSKIRYEWKNVFKCLFKFALSEQRMYTTLIWFPISLDTDLVFHSEYNYYNYICIKIWFII